MSESSIAITVGLSGSFVCLDDEGIVIKEIPFSGTAQLPATDPQEESDDGLDL